MQQPALKTIYVACALRQEHFPGRSSYSRPKQSVSPLHHPASADTNATQVKFHHHNPNRSSTECHVYGPPNAFNGSPGKPCSSNLSEHFQILPVSKLIVILVLL